MPSCEKCWGDAYMRMHTNPVKSQAEHYVDLVKERRGEKACTPEQQAGPDATVCKKCGREAVHQVLRVCMNCGADANEA